MQDAPAAFASRIISDRVEAVRRARLLAERFRERAAAVDATRQIPIESIRELHESGLFAIVTPKMWGGSELGFDALLEATIEVGAGCGSTGWVLGVLAGHTWLLAKLPIEAQREVFADPDVLISSLVRLGGTAPERVPGGFRWKGGRGKFCSGIDFATWVLVGGLVREPDGRDVHRYFVIPREDVEIIDDWQSVGLRGTSSKSILIRDAFIPEHRSVAFTDMQDGETAGARHHGSFYRLPFQSVWPLSLPGAALGTARAALEEFKRTCAARLEGLNDEQIAEQTAAFVRYADAAAQLDAAQLLLLSGARRLNDLTASSELTAFDRATNGRNLSYCVQQSREVTTKMFEASGGNAVYETQPIQRIWRDNGAATAHFAFAWDRVGATYGRMALGLGPSKYDRAGR